ncbi:MAG: CHAD domain-containing protein [Proteobacteria bacterium]|nr:CHAD domain-containing protein [Pseudomonadota bacterium]
MTPRSRVSECTAFFQDRLHAFNSELARYLKHADEEAIHDVRTSYRRLQAAYRVLPQGLKTPQSGSYLKLCRQFFRCNSLIRDCDVMLDKFAKSGVASRSGIFSSLKKTRKHQLQSALELAKQLDQHKSPLLNEPDPDGMDLLELQVHKRAMQFLSNLPLVLAAESNVEEVHEMRKDAKKLFYLLEQDTELASLGQMIHIKFFQRLSGDIHDCDVAIAHVVERLQQKVRADKLHSLLDTLQEERHLYYLELGGLLTDHSWQELASLGRAEQPTQNVAQQSRSALQP